MKICIKCHIEKDESEFYFRKDSNCYRTECKNCFMNNDLKGVRINIKILKDKTILKKCGNCQQWQELFNFNKNKHNKDGYVNWCRKCENKKIKEYRENRPWLFTLRSIKVRCNNKNNHKYPVYGGRGIKCLITAEELKIIWFRDKAYLMKNPSIDRIDNDGNYTLDNCQFIEMAINTVKDRCKPIIQYDLKGNVIKEWKSGIEAAQGTNQTAANIYLCLYGIYKQAKGSIWRYK